MAVLSPKETTAALNEFVSEKHLGILTLVKTTFDSSWVYVGR